MKVREIMSRQVEFCEPGTNLAEAAELMWTHDCGALPVLDHGKLAGIVTDRDLFIALGTRNLPASEVFVGDVFGAPPVACNPEDDVTTAMHMMRAAKVRRLPVVNAAGTLEGIVALSDIAVHTPANARSGYEDTAKTLKVICEHPPRKGASEDAGGEPLALAMTR